MVKMGLYVCGTVSTGAGVVSSWCEWGGGGGGGTFVPFLLTSPTQV